MNALTLPVVHPAFRLLKKNGRLLHLLAAALLLAHAVSHFLMADSHIVYPICLLLLAFDIFILALSKQNNIGEQPQINLFFRVLEFLLFLGIGTELLYRTQWINGTVHCAIGTGYIYLFYCEKTVIGEERVSIHHTGITIPALPESKFFSWSNIRTITADYSSISIHTSLQKSYHFHLQQNLQFDELDQIHEFCRHYLGHADSFHC